jgi:aspartate/methionine/tyrosine aminotransferase
MLKKVTSDRPERFTESVIREMTRLAQLENAINLARFLVRDAGIAAAPGSSFYHEPKPGSRFIRFCFCKQESTLREASQRLQRISGPRVSQSG